MKKVLFALLVGATLGSALELKNYLSDDYNELFDTELQKSFVDSKYNSLTWVSPIMLSFERSWNTRIEGTHSPLNTYSIGIEQPIFKSGGIYYGIKFAKAKYQLEKISIIKEKNKLNAQALELLYKIKQVKLTIAKLKLQIKNADIEINSTSDLYNAGLSSSVDLDKAYARKDEAQIALLDLKATLAELKGAFRKISDKNPDRLKTPRLKMLSKQRFISSNLDIDSARANARTQEYVAKMTRSKYLPTISVSARYTKVSKAQPFTKREFANYGVRISMPISINASNDLESAKLNGLIAKIKAKTVAKSAKEEYKTKSQKIAIINRRIAVANKEARIYARLLRSTKSLYRAGQKSINDVNLLRNSLKIKRLEAQIYGIDRQLELLKLYAKVR